MNRLPTLAPVRKISVEVRAADVLRTAIVNGRIAPGSRITESQLAARMQLSRASVRAALHQLAKEGLTCLTPYTGWHVVSLGADDVWELYTLRSSLERLAARLLVEAGEVRKIAAFEAAYQVLAQRCADGDEAGIVAADFALHKALITLSGHGRLNAQYEMIERQIRLCIAPSDALADSPASILEQHRPLAEAVLAGDAAQAAWHAELHNLTEGAKLRVHLQQAGERAGQQAATD